MRCCGSGTAVGSISFVKFERDGGGKRLPVR